MTPIGIIHSCFTEKFGIPRQPGLVPEARATLELYAPYGSAEALAGLEGFSHLWVIFVFHQALRDPDQAGDIGGQWRPSVRPPRLGGNRTVGVFASRSPFRPNALGLSVVRLEAVDCRQPPCTLRLSGVDILDGSPVLDIKPYVPYADALPEARAGFADAAPASPLTVHFSTQAAAQCAVCERTRPGLRPLIEQLLSQDPRPAYMAGRDTHAGRSFGMRLYDLDVRWRVEDNQVHVTELVAPSAG